MKFKDKKVTVMGLGLQGSGVEMVKFLVKQGAQVMVTDIKTAETLKPALEKLKGLKNVKYILGMHRSEDFSKTDLVIKGPGVAWNSKYLEIAKKYKVPVETEAGLFIKLNQNPFVGITGTRGKSTTTQLIFEILKKAGQDVLIGGNMQEKPLIKLLTQVKKTSTWLILELSSFQLEGMRCHKRSAQVAVLTNLMADHLNRYKNLEAYHKSKHTILEFQNQDDFAVLNYDDEKVRGLTEITKAKVMFFSGQKIGCENAVYLDQDKVIFKTPNQKEQEIVNINNLKLIGEHRHLNVLAAIAVAKIFKVENQTIKQVVENFAGIEHRLEPVKQIDQVSYVNDTTATVPEATINAIKAFDQVILIAGGTDKKLDFTGLAGLITKQVKKLILVPGSGTDRIVNAIRKYDPDKLKQENWFFKAQDLDEAVKIAKEQAQAQDTVLLSPACSSFNQFNNEFERGQVFKQAVEGLS
ncbi:MAG: UDP-N-acetylmuramoyl-L-alanine--D-glutamate ligase [Candidatus Moranbacteria bacterium]|nr:UDP-N-acetylmuramoyl-L-alanine--D-glutamate ligase [Candidatus Moranbacteria bacterium]